MVDEHLDFNIFDAFEALDKERKGFITVLDLVEGLESFKILDMPQYCQEATVKMFLNEYGPKSDTPGQSGRLRISDFANIVGPIQNSWLHKILMNRKSSGFYFAGESLLLYRRLWQLLFDVLEENNQTQTLICNTLEKRCTGKGEFLKSAAAMQALDNEATSYLKN